MKHLKLLSIFLILFLGNCEKVVEIDVPTIPPKLIVEASFEVFFNQNPVNANTVVKLKLSANYFDKTISAITNAIVFITNLSDNTVINFADVNLNGNYKPTSNFIPEDNIVYELTIIHDNQTYKGKATKVKSTPLKSIVQGDKTLFSGKETELKVDFKDNGALENHYLFNFTQTIYLALEDRYFNGTNYNFSYFLQEDKIELPTNITVKMTGISKEHYTYFRVLIDQSGQNAGGPFQSVPSSLLGNMVNTTNKENFPLGYFHIGESDTFSLDIVEKNK